MGIGQTQIESRAANDRSENGYCGECHISLASQIAEIVNARYDFAATGILKIESLIQSVSSVRYALLRL